MTEGRKGASVRFSKDVEIIKEHGYSRESLKSHGQRMGNFGFSKHGLKRRHGGFDRTGPNRARNGGQQKGSPRARRICGITLGSLAITLLFVLGLTALSIGAGLGATCYFEQNRMSNTENTVSDTNQQMTRSSADPDHDHHPLATRPKPNKPNKHENPAIFSPSSKPSDEVIVKALVPRVPQNGSSSQKLPENKNLQLNQGRRYIDDGISWENAEDSPLNDDKPIRFSQRETLEDRLKVLGSQVAIIGQNGYPYGTDTLASSQYQLGERTSMESAQEEYTRLKESQVAPLDDLAGNLKVLEMFNNPGAVAESEVSSRESRYQEADSTDDKTAGKVTLHDFDPFGGFPSRAMSAGKTDAARAVRTDWRRVFGQCGLSALVLGMTLILTATILSCRMYFTRRSATIRNLADDYQNPQAREKSRSKTEESKNKWNNQNHANQQLYTGQNTQLIRTQPTGPVHGTQHDPSVMEGTRNEQAQDFRPRNTIAAPVGHVNDEVYSTASVFAVPGDEEAGGVYWGDDEEGMGEEEAPEEGESGMMQYAYNSAYRPPGGSLPDMRYDQNGQQQSFTFTPPTENLGITFINANSQARHPEDISDETVDSNATEPPLVYNPHQGYPSQIQFDTSNERNYNERDRPGQNKQFVSLQQQPNPYSTGRVAELARKFAQQQEDTDFGSLQRQKRSSGTPIANSKWKKGGDRKLYSASSSPTSCDRSSCCDTACSCSGSCQSPISDNSEPCPVHGKPVVKKASAKQQRPK